MRANCNADYRHPCDVNDGEPCADCAAWLADVEASARYAWAGMTQQERDPKKYEQDMRDAERAPRGWTTHDGETWTSRPDPESP